MYIVKMIYIRRILNSGGCYALEAEVTISIDASKYVNTEIGGDTETEFTGRASSPAAILAGYRERKITFGQMDQVEVWNRETDILIGKPYTQGLWDNELEENQDLWGTDLTLALSLAFARAAADADQKDLVCYIRDCMADAGEKQRPELLSKEIGSAGFFPLVPIFSGGVHDKSLGGSMQQVMLLVKQGHFQDTAGMILEFYNYMEKWLVQTDRLKGYSASSGFLVSGMTMEEKFLAMENLIYKLQMDGNFFIGIDVAAEHLKQELGYRFHHKLISADELEQVILNLVQRFPISYVEDPFDSDDYAHWMSFYRKKPDSVEVISDDMSATQAVFLDADVSDGIVIKMKQVGTLTGTLETVLEARNLGLSTCVSHRSYETEDTFLCDLGVAIGTRYMKIGGPRRGDRVGKYNRLLRLSEKYQ